MAGRQATLDLGLLLSRRLVIRGSVLRGRSRAEKAGLVASFSSEVGPALRSGTIRPVIDRVVPFAEIDRGYSELAAGGVFGKIVVEMP